MLLANPFVESGWIVEQSAKSLPFTSNFIALAIVSLTAASSPRQVKIMSALDTASSKLDATVDFPGGNCALRSVARVCVRLKMMSGLLRSPFSTRFLHMPLACVSRDETREKNPI